MKKRKLIIKINLALSLIIILSACQKLTRPDLGDYIKDSNPPGGPLKFYVAFDGTTADPLRNAVDSVKANFAVSNPLVSITGISGKGIQGAPAKDKAIKYAAPNDWAKSTSWSISYWMKNVPATDGEPEFHFSLHSPDPWHQSGLFLLVEKGGPNPGNSTPTQMAAKLAIDDNDGWVEFIGANRLPNLLNNQWHHVVFVYSETDSRVRAYVDGVLSVTSAEVKHGGVLRGARPFKKPGNFIIGGWNKHVSGVGGPNDSWIHSYSGQMDQFRLYGKALSASEVLALFNSKL